MVERVFGARSEPDLVDELGGDQLVDNRIDLKAGQQITAEARPDDRRGGKGGLGAGPSRSMRAAMVACNVAGTLTSATSVRQA